MINQLKQKIVDAYSEYSKVDAIVKQKNQAIVDKKTNLNKEGKSIEELQDILVYTYVDTILYNKDLQLLFAKLIPLIDFYKEIESEELPKEIEGFYKDFRQWMPKRIFAVEKDDLVEAEEGILNTERQNFLNSDFFKGLQQQLNNTPSK